MVTSIIESTSPIQEVEGPPVRPKVDQAVPFDHVFVCRFEEHRISAVTAVKDREGVSGQWIGFGDNKTEGKIPPTKRRRRGTPCILWLPKSTYLHRILSLPTASPEELRAMIRLEIEAGLPADYGPIEVGYRPLAEAGRYETCAVKRSTVDAALQELEQHGIRPNYVLPSSLFYSAILQPSEESPDLFAVQVADVSTELSFLNRDGSVSVRAFKGRRDSDILLGVTDTIRSMSSERFANAQKPSDRQDEKTITLDWFGNTALADVLPETVSIRQRDGDFCLINLPSESNAHTDSILGLVARSALEGRGGHRDWSTFNLLPAAYAASHEKHRLCRQLAFGALGFLASLGLLYVALTLSTSRYQAEIDGLSSEIQKISAAGEAVGAQLEQLEAVAQARQTSDAFGLVVAALHDASPRQGLSYSQVDLNTDSQLQLRGQALSLATPFELLELLESEPCFEGVKLRDAGQVKKGVGSITEFRIEAKLVKTRPDPPRAGQEAAR